MSELSRDELAAWLLDRADHEAADAEWHEKEYGVSETPTSIVQGYRDAAKHHRAAAAALLSETPAEDGRVFDLVMLVVRLSRRTARDDAVRLKALDYLARHNLMPNVMRTETDNAAEQSTRDAEVRRLEQDRDQMLVMLAEFAESKGDFTVVCQDVKAAAIRRLAAQPDAKEKS